MRYTSLYLILLWTFAVQSLIVLAEISRDSNILDGHTNDLPAIDYLSCRNKCGSFVSKFCSCDVICSVYHTCCDDFITECGSTIIKTDKKYEPYQNVQVECSQDNILYISSCRQDLQKVKDRAASKKLEAKSTPDLTDLYSNKWTLEDIWQNAPVIDLNSRLTFKNRSIFECNSLDVSIPLMWDARFEHLDMTERDGNIFMNLDSKYIASYTTSIDIETYLNPHMCIHYSVSDCNNPQYKDKCSALKSYVRAENLQVYDNVYCAICAGFNDTSLLMPVTSIGNAKKLRYSMSSKAFSNTITFRSGDTSAKQAWLTLECTLHQGSQHHCICKVTTCNSLHFKLYAGQCVQLFVLSLAFFNQEIKHSPKELQQISSFIMCMLKYFADYIIVGEWKPARIVTDPQAFYSYNVLFYPTEDVASEYANQINNINYSILNIISVLLEFHLAEDKGRSLTDQSVDQINRTETDTQFKPLQIHGSLSNVSTSLLGGDENGIVCACHILLADADMMSPDVINICNHTCFKSHNTNNISIYYESICPFDYAWNVNSVESKQLNMLTSFLLVITYIFL